MASDALIDALWPGQPPDTAAKALHVYVSGLRRALGPGATEVLQTRPAGYTVVVDADALDRDRFERLLVQGRAAREAGEAAEAGATLRKALSLWHGPPLADFRYEPFAQTEIARLEELRVAAAEERIEADLARGHHADLVGELEALIAQNPLRERLRGQLMLALYRSGRQAEALDVYQETRRALVEELGIEPSPPLRELEAAILRQDEALASPAPPVAVSRDRGRTGQPDTAEVAESRKLVTVLLCEVTPPEDGPAADPEALRRVTSRYLALATEVVERHGASAETFLGDAVMAVFGVPRVHEDDAVRAARAAVELRDAAARLGNELAAAGDVRIGVRVALDTGEVIASPEGGRASSVTGEVVTAAARLVQAADAGEIRVGQATYGLVKHDVVAEVAEAIPARGRRSPIPAYELRAVLPPAFGRGRRLDSPMVGRAHESALLAGAFDGAVRERACRLVTVLGDAGVGKSRLALEFAGSLGDRATVLVGRCLPYGEGITFWPIRELLREAAQLRVDEPSERVLAFAAALLEGDADADVVVERLRDVLGLGEAPVTSEEIFWAVRRVLDALARRRPLAVVFEDVHWAQPTLLDLVDYLRDWSQGVPLVLVCLARPEFLQQRPGWSRRRDDALVFLEALTPAESGELLDQLAGEAPLPTAARERIANAAEGNPLFLEQILALVAERGGAAQEELAIPPSIHALLGARLDALPGEERAVVDRAAVIGRSFPCDAVHDLLPDDARQRLAERLMALSHKEFVSADSAADERERIFRFRHILIRDAAYAAVPKEARADFHRRFADWLDERPGEYDEIVGYHLEQAFRYRAELAPVGPADRALAAEASKRLDASGRRAYSRSDLPAAVNLLERAAALVENGAETRADVLPRLGVALTDAGRLADAASVLDEAVDAARTLTDERREAHALLERLALGIQVDTERATREAAAIGERVRRIFEESGDDRGLCKLWRLRGLLHWLAGQSAAADLAWGQAGEHAREAGDEWERSEILTWIASSALVGPTPVPRAIARCEAIREDVAGDPRSGAVVLYPLAGLYAMTGRFELARELLASAYETLEALGFMILIASFAYSEAFVEVLAGDLARAEERLRAGCDRLEQMGEKQYLSFVAAALGDVLCKQGRHDEAERFVALSEKAAAPGDLAAQVTWRCGRAQILAAAGSLDQAEALTRTAVAIAKNMDFLGEQSTALLTLGEILAQASRPDDAGRAFEDALGVFERKGNLVAAESTRALLSTMGAA